MRPGRPLTRRLPPTTPRRPFITDRLQVVTDAERRRAGDGSAPPLRPLGANVIAAAFLGASGVGGPAGGLGGRLAFERFVASAASVGFSLAGRSEHIAAIDATELTASAGLGAAFWPIAPAQGFAAPPEDFQIENPRTLKCDVVGPVCESADFIAKDREVAVLEQGDLLAVMSAGAYGFSLSSNYNSRPRAAEVLVSGETYQVIRRRESYEDLVRLEEDDD